MLKHIHKKHKEKILVMKIKYSKIINLFFFNLKKYHFKILSWLRSSEFKRRQRNIKGEIQNGNEYEAK